MLNKNHCQVVFFKPCQNTCQYWEPKREQAVFISVDQNNLWDSREWTTGIWKFGGLFFLEKRCGQEKIVKKREGVEGLKWQIKLSTTDIAIN